MNPLDTISIIGEILAWVGLSLGLLCLLLAPHYRRTAARTQYVDALVFAEGPGTFIRYMASGGMHERHLTYTELRSMEHGWQLVLVDTKTHRKPIRHNLQDLLEVFALLTKDPPRCRPLRFWALLAIYL